MRIIPMQRFRDGRNTFEVGEEYAVPDADAVYYVRSGWAASPDYTAPDVAAPTTVDLVPDSASHNPTATQPQGV